MPARSKTSRRLFTVFEVIDDKNREIRLRATWRPIFEVVETLPEGVRVRSLAFSMSSAEARNFIAAYLKQPLPPGWRFLTR